MIVKEAVLAEYKKHCKDYGAPDIELGVMTLDEFKHHADWGSDNAWDMYNFAHLAPLTDKTGQLQKIFAKKSGVPADKLLNSSIAL